VQCAAEADIIVHGLYIGMERAHRQENQNAKKKKKKKKKNHYEPRRHARHGFSPRVCDAFAARREARTRKSANATPAERSSTAPCCADNGAANPLMSLMKILPCGICATQSLVIE